MMHTHTSLFAAVLLAIASASASATTTIDQSVAMAGSLQGDSAGFPVTITKPGHYLLTGNLVVPQGVNAIVIQAEGVTLDLGGHTVSSDADCRQNTDTRTVNCLNVRPIYDDLIRKSSSGVLLESDGAVVRNGVVRGFRGHGVYVSASNVRVDDVRAISNQHYGIYLGSPILHARVSDSAAFLNGSDGIYGSGAMIERTNASNNGGSGVRGWAIVVVDSTITYNGQHGLEGYPTAGLVAVRGSLVFSNKPINLGPATQSLGGNHRGDIAF